MTTTTLSQLTDDIHRQVNNLQSQGSNEILRQDLVRLARSLLYKLETPHERLAHIAYHDFSLYPVVRVLLELGVFRTLDGASRSMSATQLAEESGADVPLLERLLKHVAVTDLIEETGPDQYAANDMTRCLASPGGEGLILDIWIASSKAYASFPDYFRANGYSNPSHKEKSPWYALYGQHYFEYIFAPGREQEKRAFHNHMSFKAFGMKWWEVPGILEGVFGNDPKPTTDQALIVDVGGSTGRDLLDFVSAHPELQGRKILQDLPTTIDGLDKDALLSAGVEAMAHDFFTPQPIQHAKAYYLKFVLHDWPAEQCRQILSNVRSAMKPGYSRILVNEFVVPETNARWYESSLDILMMAVHGARERREKEWRELVDQVEGLRVKKIWFSAGVGEQIIEIERVK